MKKLVLALALAGAALAGVFASQASADGWQCRWVTANGPNYWQLVQANHTYDPLQGDYVEAVQTAGAGATPNAYIRIADAGGHPYCTWGSNPFYRNSYFIWGCYHASSSYGYPIGTDIIQVSFRENNSYAYYFCAHNPYH